MADLGGLERVDLADGGNDALLRAFYDGLYLDAFAHQREPLEVWQRLLHGDEPTPLDFHLVVAGENLSSPAPTIAGGVVFEYYPRSACGLVTYLVVAPSHRRRGLGRGLIEHATEVLRATAADRGRALGAVFAEASDPRRYTGAKADTAWQRIERFQRWGARVAGVDYVQPDLGAGAGRDDALVLLAFEPRAPTESLADGILAAFLAEFFAVTEPPDRAPDGELLALLDASRGDVSLRAMSRENPHDDDD